MALFMLLMIILVDSAGDSTTYWVNTERIVII